MILITYQLCFRCKSDTRAATARKCRKRVAVSRGRKPDSMPEHGTLAQILRWATMWPGNCNKYMPYNKAEDTLSGIYPKFYMDYIWNYCISLPDIAFLCFVAWPDERGSLRDSRQDLQRVFRHVRLRLLPHGGQECEERLLEDQSWNPRLHGQRSRTQQQGWKWYVGNCFIGQILLEKVAWMVCSIGSEITQPFVTISEE